jgi:hypothetical protein
MNTFEKMEKGLACPLCGLDTPHPHRNPWFGLRPGIPKTYVWYPPSHYESDNLEKENES